MGKTEYIQIAQQLCYSADVIDSLRKAKTETEMNKIMENTRRRLSARDSQLNCQVRISSSGQVFR